MTRKFKAEKENQNRRYVEKGETFYEAMPLAVAHEHTIELPRINKKTADFLEGVVIFFAGTVEVLLLLRVVLMIFHVSGGNLLTYLLYAVSYPFVLILNSGQGQIPEITNQILYENIALLFIYLVAFYGLARMINALQKQEN